ncbi:MAG: hypothetical protein QM791_02350 [Ferruginibacter sp.]
MMTKKYTKLAFLLFAVLIAITVTAQTDKPAKTTSIPIVKFKPPVVKISWGRLTGPAASCVAEEAKQLVKLPLKVTDAKNTSYQVVSYQLTYKRLGVTEDEETGKVTPASDQVGRSFTETPLPEVWQTNIIEQVHKGEELYFFDVVVYDKQGRRFFAPELKITIQ